MTNLVYRTDWFKDINSDEVMYFWGTRKQCMAKARSVSKKNDTGAFVVASDPDSEVSPDDVGCICFTDGTISYREGDKI